MAATKKHIAIQGQKKQLAEHINSLNAEIRKHANKVPAVVLNGSHQLAVAWKELAESVFKRDLSGAPNSLSVDGMQERINEKNDMLRKLKGVGLL